VDLSAFDVVGSQHPHATLLRAAWFECVMTFSEFVTATDAGVRSLLSKQVVDQLTLEASDDSATWIAGNVGARIELVGAQRLMLRFLPLGIGVAGDHLGYEPLDDLAVAGFVQRVALILARAEAEYQACARARFWRRCFAPARARSPLRPIPVTCDPWPTARDRPRGRIEKHHPKARRRSWARWRPVVVAGHLRPLGSRRSSALRENRPENVARAVIDLCQRLRRR